MTWDEQLFALLEDLEAQAESAYDLERAVEVVDRARAEYAAVTLAARLHAAADTDIVLQVAGVGPLVGRLARVAAGWCLLEARGAEWIVRLEAVTAARGLPTRAIPAEAWPVTARLGLGSALRRLAEARSPSQVLLVDGSRLEVRRMARVGDDFVEMLVGERNEPVLQAFAWIAAICSRD